MGDRKPLGWHDPSIGATRVTPSAGIAEAMTGSYRGRIHGAARCRGPIPGIYLGQYVIKPWPHCSKGAS